jgi:hypothetical protein
MNPVDYGKNPDIPGSPESPGFSSPEFSGFTAKTLTHNTAQINHPKHEIMQI